MNTGILAKILGIITKTKERLIVLDPQSGAPFVVMSLDEYEKLTIQGHEGVSKAQEAGQLTPREASGTIDPDLALWREAKRGAVGEWGGDDGAEEDRYYLEPTE